MVTVIFTCFNRKEKTLTCVKSISEGNPRLKFRYIVLDDNSIDGTVEALEELKKHGYEIDIFKGDGNSYWAGGMRKAIAHAKEKNDSEYYLLVNDDVYFYPEAIERMIEEQKSYVNDMEKSVVLVGPMCDEGGAFSYGGIRYIKGIRYENVTPYSVNKKCDSFNMNCLLLEQEVFMDAPNFDVHYVHSLADFDYGLAINKMGIPIYVTNAYVGVCPDNDPKGGWSDKTLSRRERLRKKESIKGAPFKPWFYFLKKNFGVGRAIVHSVTPYVRIILGK